MNRIYLWEYHTLLIVITNEYNIFVKIPYSLNGYNKWIEYICEDTMLS